MPLADPGPETVLFSGRKAASAQLAAFAALGLVHDADIGALEIVARHAGKIVIEAAGIAEGLHRPGAVEAIAALLEDDIPHLPKDLAARLVQLLSVEILAVGAAESLIAIGPRRARRGDGGQRAEGDGKESKGDTHRGISIVDPRAVKPSHLNRC